jgi:Ca2+-binding RTX toxin-like protein
VVTALTSTDVDTVGTNPAVFSIIGGADAALFDVVSGNLVFRNAPDYETNPHSYAVQVSAFDGINTAAKTISVSVTNVAGVTINGTSGNDTINATTTVAGQSRPTGEEDTINGGSGNDTINALGGNDVINGGAGADTMFGGPGNDTYVVDNTGDVVNETGGDGVDTVQSSITFSLSDALHAVGVLENLALTGTAAINGTGNALANVLTGNSGSNTLDGGAGADTMAGGAGNDTYVVDNIGDVVTENSNGGTDTVQSSITYALTANVENLTLTGTGTINGTGNSLNNAIVGNSANNILDGGAGADTLTGGLGADQFKFDTALTASGRRTPTDVETIADFNHAQGDKIDLDHSIFAALTSGPLGNPISANDFYASASGSAHLATDHILYNSATGALSYDPDGTGSAAAMRFATLTNHPALVAGDFLLV